MKYFLYFSAVALFMRSQLSLAAERVSWSSREISLPAADSQYKLYSLKAAQELFEGAHVGTCRFDTRDFVMRNPTHGGDYELLRLQWMSPADSVIYQMRIGTTEHYFSSNTFSRSLVPKARLATDGTPLWVVDYQGNVRSDSPYVMRITALVDANDKIHRVAAMKTERDYKCSELNVGAICAGIGEVKTIDQPETLFDCGSHVAPL